MNQELLDYIAQSRKAGTADDEIKKQLLASGWQEGDVSMALGLETPAIMPDNPAVSQPGVAQFRTASQKRRFWNNIIDDICFLLLSQIVLFGITRIFGTLDFVFGWFIQIVAFPFVYYSAFESFLGRTPGKFITKTKVVLRDGSSPSIKVILLRTLIRFVPFDALSFVKDGVGWHDRWSGTMVVEPASLPEPKRVRFWKILFRICAVPQFFALLICYVVAPLFVFLLVFPGKDIPPPDDSDIRLEVINVPDEQNGFFDAMRIKDVIYHPDSVFEFTSGTRWDEKEVEEILLKNSDTLELVNAILQKPYFQEPYYADPKNMSIPQKEDGEFLMSTDLRAAGRIVALGGRYLARIGRPYEAMDASLAMIELGDKIQKSQGLISLYLAGNAIKVNVLRQSRSIFNHQDILKAEGLSSEKLVAYTEALKKYRNTKEDIARAIKSEKYYVNISESLTREVYLSLREKLGEEAAKKFLTTNFTYKPNITQQLYDESIRKNLKNIEGFCNSIVPMTSSVLSSYIIGSDGRLSITKLLYGVFTRGNPIGEIFVSLISLDLSNVAVKKCESDFNLEAVRLAYAIRAYELENKKLPDNLDELVPRYISEVPVDPFDGRPMRYSATDRLIYSEAYNAREEWWKPKEPDSDPINDFKYRF